MGIEFFKRFLFGTATASHQIEGDNVWNDWWYYEQMGKLPYKSGKACNHWELYKDDIVLMHSLGYDAYRFSIEWSRIFPKADKIDETALNKYREIIELLLEMEIVPNITLHHFTSPLWFMQKGGFAKEENLKHWEKYVEIVSKILEGVQFVATFNEPLVFHFLVFQHTANYCGKKGPQSFHPIGRLYDEVLCIPWELLFVFS